MWCTPDSPRTLDTFMWCTPDSPRTLDTFMWCTPDSPRTLDTFMWCTPDSPRTLDTFMWCTPDSPRTLDTFMWCTQTHHGHWIPSCGALRLTTDIGYLHVVHSRLTTDIGYLHVVHSRLTTDIGYLHVVHSRLTTDIGYLHVVHSRLTTDIGYFQHGWNRHKAVSKYKETLQHVAASVTTVSTPGHVTDQERGWAQGTGLLSPADDFSSLHSPGLGVMLDGDSTSPCFSKCSYCLLFHAEPAHSHLNSLARMVPVFLATYVKVQEQPYSPPQELVEKQCDHVRTLRVGAAERMQDPTAGS
ncbi:hypothetical protein RRG08_021568 [Elysia crispata]|uniref:Uncharacterized protein n=1 Tax=Elysia crispata TaxID=231223 RepID=A0AAE1CEG4_9GAST|nr:hypothetical protein RRG08_021568 [Elysia crispata]